MAKLIIEFPSDEDREAFLNWFADGGGDQELFRSEEVHAARENRKPINHFDYAKAFEEWGYNPKVDGPDKVVKASNVGT